MVEFENYIKNIFNENIDISDFEDDMETMKENAK